MSSELPRLLDPTEYLDRVAAARAAGVDVVVVDLCRSENYRAGHVPGALHLEPAELVAGTPPAVGKLPEVARLQALAHHLGLTPATWVIAYDDEGGGWAGRLIWTLEVIGHRNWSYLDGGLPAWVAAELPLDSTIDARPSSPAYPISLQARPRVLIDELIARHRATDVRIWDARSLAEHLGQRTGSRHAGRIPGATHLDWLELMDPARDYRLRTDLPALLARHGLGSGQEIVTHCQTHHRSGLSYLVGRLLGLDIRAYDGSWSEWGNRDDTPIERG